MISVGRLRDLSCLKMFEVRDHGWHSASHIQVCSCVHITPYMALYINIVRYTDTHTNMLFVCCICLCAHVFAHVLNPEHSRDRVELPDGSVVLCLPGHGLHGAKHRRSVRLWASMEPLAASVFAAAGGPHLRPHWRRAFEQIFGGCLCDLLLGEGGDSGELCALHLLSLDHPLCLSSMLDHQDCSHLLVGLGKPHQGEATSSAGSEELWCSKSLLVIDSDRLSLHQWNSGTVVWESSCTGCHSQCAIKISTLQSMYSWGETATGFASEPPPGTLKRCHFQCHTAGTAAACKASRIKLPKMSRLTSAQ